MGSGAVALSAVTYHDMSRAVILEDTALAEQLAYLSEQDK